MFPSSSYKGQAVAAFPDVCKTPAPAGPVPIPYPNIALGTGTSTVSPTTSLRAMQGRFVGSLQSIASTQSAASKLRSQLQTLHAQMIGLPGSNPNRWHELVDQYVMTAAELYKALAGR
jgi:Toxin PAAR-like domain